MNARHNLASLRLKHNVTKVGPMTQPSQSSYSEDISLPSIAMPDDEDDADDDDDEDDDNEAKGGKTNTNRRKSSVSDRKKSRQFSFIATNLVNGHNENEIKKPDQEKLNIAMKKVTDAAIDTVPHYLDVELNRRKDKKLQQSRKFRRSDSHHSKSAIAALERKLVNSIKRCHAETDNIANPENATATTVPHEKFVLKTRDLIPHYKVSDVKNFLNAFFRVDKNLSGYLELEEWVEFFQDLNASMSALSARLLFSHVDVNGDGVLSLHELVPVIFPEASLAQVKLILKFIDDEITRSMSQYNRQDVHKEDMAILFESYDIDNIGYIKVQMIRNKIMRFQLPVSAQLAFNELLSGVEDGDMVNLPQFTRMFVTYLSLEPKDQNEEA